MIPLRSHPIKKYILTFVILLYGSLCFSQISYSDGNFWSKVRYGGGLGLGFGNNSFNAAVSPSAIYQANPYFAIGTGLSFNYSKFRDSRLTAYGGSLISLVNPIREIQLSAEFEQLRVNQRLELDGSPDLEDNYWLPALYLGIGYSNQNVTIGIRYDVLYDDGRSIYADPWAPFVRVYF